MHPPWRPAAGTVFAEYRVKLPDVAPLTLAFANAIRDNTAAEPPSDGVTFRVWAGEQKLFERHTDSKQWVDGTADLSAYPRPDDPPSLGEPPRPQTRHDLRFVLLGRADPHCGRVARAHSRDREAGEAGCRSDSRENRRLATGTIFSLDGGYRVADPAGRRRAVRRGHRHRE